MRTRNRSPFWRPDPLPAPVDFEQQYLAERPTIERTIASISGRYRLSPQDRDDFTSAVHLHLIRDDYKVFRMYEGRAPLGVYLLTVVRQHFQEWRNQQWGRWKPSAAARRLGPVAILLETLLVREGLTLDQALEVARSNHGVVDSVGELRAMAERLPARTVRTHVPLETVDGRLQASTDPIDGVREREARRLGATLDDALNQLPVQDRLIVTMRFEQDVPLIAIARSLGLEYQHLYRRVERLLAGLRRALESGGFGASDVAELFSHRGLVDIDRRST